MPEQWHLTEELFRRFLERTTTSHEGKKILRHLLHRCDRCAVLARRVALEAHIFPERQKIDLDQLAHAFKDAIDFGTSAARRIALERLEGWGLWSYLEPFSPEERASLVRSDAGLQTWGLHQRLLEASQGYIRSDPAEAVDILQLAVEVAGRIDPETVAGQERKQDLLAEALASLANAQRIASDFEGARASLNDAWLHYGEGTGDPLTKAHIINLEANWLRDMGEFETAEAALQEALAIYKKIDDPHQQGRILLKMGAAIGYVDPPKCIALTREALRLIDRAVEPRLELCAQHNLAWFFAQAGEGQLALDVLDRARPLYRQFPDRYTQLRLHWLEGKIARNLGQLGSALHIFRLLWEQFRARDLHHETLLVSIDLAETYVARGAFEPAEKLVREVYPIMASWKLHRHALAAWLVLQEALELRQIDGVFDRLQLYYRRYWNKAVEFGDRQESGQ
ncbi:MAG TPA: tetratricopeptide repeat protein [Thermoanaerobaculia bacterium]|nr:tetratricopeptide repeat protein [Thermoanaerobaculia bacterium]